jgi:hypothetical protein
VEFSSDGRGGVIPFLIELERESMAEEPHREPKTFRLSHYFENSIGIHCPSSVLPVVHPLLLIIAIDIC